jgi:hypothetical protein
MFDQSAARSNFVLDRIISIQFEWELEPMFVKLFHQVVYSSLTQKEPVYVRGVFFMLMAIADKSGAILGTDESIARIINVPMEEFESALGALMAEDPDSQSKEYGGRRVVRLESAPGLFLVNYVKYSEIGSDEQRREYFRQKKAESRERLSKQREGVKDVKDRVKDKFTKPTLEEVKLMAVKVGLPASEAEKFFNYYESNGWKVGKNRMQSYSHAMGGWKLRWEAAGRVLPGMENQI